MQMDNNIFLYEVCHLCVLWSTTFMIIVMMIIQIMIIILLSCATLRLEENHSGQMAVRCVICSVSAWHWWEHVFQTGFYPTVVLSVFLRVKEHKKGATELILVKKFFIYFLELSFRAEPLSKVVTIFDMTDAGLSNLVSILHCAFVC